MMQSRECHCYLALVKHWLIDLHHVAGPHVLYTVIEQRLAVKILLLIQRLIDTQNAASTFIMLVKFDYLQPLYPKMNGIYSYFLS